jgi:hypothetical protein
MHRANNDIAIDVSCATDQVVAQILDSRVVRQVINADHFCALTEWVSGVAFVILVWLVDDIDV